MRRVLKWLTTHRNLAILLLSLNVWLFVKLGLRLHSSTAWLVAAIHATAIVGLACRRSWALWLGALLIALSAFDAGRKFVTKGWRWRDALQSGGLAFLAWSLAKAPDSGLLEDSPDGAATEEDENKTLISLVHLRRSQRYLEPLILAHALSDAWGLNITSSEDETTLEAAHGFVVGAESTYFVWVVKPKPFCFLVHNHEGSYWSDSEGLAEKVPNLRFAEIIREHGGWLAVDLLDRASGKTDPEEAYRLIGKAVASLADSDTLAIYCPQRNSFNLWSDDFSELLCGDDPLQAFREEVKAPVINVQHDQTLEAAVAEAQRRWPEFATAFNSREDKEALFIVKAAFAHEGNTEHMWLKVYGIEPEYVHGHLANDPFHNPNLKKGMLVEVPVAEVSDWLYQGPDGLPCGNFTGAAVNSAQRGDKRKP